MCGISRAVFFCALFWNFIFLVIILLVSLYFARKPKKLLSDYFLSLSFSEGHSKLIFG